MNRSRLSGGDMKCFLVGVETSVEPRWQTCCSISHFDCLRKDLSVCH